MTTNEILLEADKLNCNPRYLYYCKAHGFNDPEAMLERDREFWPGGVMTGFTCWISEAWWMACIDLCDVNHCKSPRDFEMNHNDAQKKFDDWLSKHYMEIPREPEDVV